MSTETATAEFEFRFRIVHLMYVTALLAASVSLLGINGIWLGVFVIAYWGILFRIDPKQQLATVYVFGFPYVFALACCLLGSATSDDPSVHHRVRCANSLKDIGVALNSYHADHGSYPPAYVTDTHGTPMHSWRVLILPYLDRQSLYDQYSFDEAWDGPNNRKLHGRIPDEFRCPATSSGPLTDTSYLAVVGPNAAWPGDVGREQKEFGQLSYKILVLENNISSTHWMEPNDMSVDEAIELLSRSEKYPGGHWSDSGLFRTKFIGRNVLYADFSVEPLKLPLPEQTLRGMCDVTIPTNPKDILRVDLDDTARINYPPVISSVAMLLLAGVPVGLSIRISRSNVCRVACESDQDNSIHGHCSSKSLRAPFDCVINQRRARGAVRDRRTPVQKCELLREQLVEQRPHRTPLSSVGRTHTTDRPD